MVLCPMQGEDDWNLWHANLRGTETEKYVYPAQSEFVGDGRGGVWVLCPTTGVEGVWRLWQWHASDHAERDLYEYPLTARRRRQKGACGCCARRGASKTPGSSGM